MPWFLWVETLVRRRKKIIRPRRKPAPCEIFGRYLRFFYEPRADALVSMGWDLV